MSARPSSASWWREKSRRSPPGRDKRCARDRFWQASIPKAIGLAWRSPTRAWVRSRTNTIAWRCCTPRGAFRESDFAKATFGLRQAKAQRQLQAKNLADTRLVCDFSGVLLQRGAEVGEIVPAGAPLFTVAGLDQVKVVASVPEQELRHLRIGQNATLRIDAIDTSLVGKVVEVGALADAATRSFSVKIEVANLRHRLRPGMIARIAIANRDSSRALLLPLASIQRRSEGDAVVYVVDTALFAGLRTKGLAGHGRRGVRGNPFGVCARVRLVATQGVSKLHDAARIVVGSIR